jgi:alpha-mannosidase
VRITGLRSTDLFTGPVAAPRQVVEVTLTGPRTAPVSVRVQGPAVSTPDPAIAEPGDGQITVEVEVVFSAPAREGTPCPVTAIAETIGGSGRLTLDGTVTVAETGWTMWLISHFHYDPVWWNTQAGFTETWLDQPLAQEKRMPFQRSAFDLVRAHLAAAREDEDYRFVLAEVDYLKPHWDLHPEDRDDLRRFIADGRIEIVGGAYNEPNTNLTHPESTIRNVIAGLEFQRDVLGADPRTAWQLDVFGHDPAFPGIMADAGLDSSVWARGPWHHVGARRHAGDITRMQFPSEFEWMSPSGRGLLTSYLADHYVAGWDIERVDTLGEAVREAYRQFSSLRQVAATRNVLLPVGHDHNLPSRFCTAVCREWNARYTWPRFVVGLPRDFFAAVRGDARRRGTTLSTQTRDMNPVYTGKDVSYIDTKQAQRAAETTVLDAERAATLAWMLGASYPRDALDKAWRLLVYGAHHDAITGTESDQVYLDLVAGWREASELGREVLTGAIGHLAEQVDTGGVLVLNTLSWERDCVTTVTLRYPEPGRRGVRITGPDGADVVAVTEAVRRHPDGTLAEITLSFGAKRMPALGYRAYRAMDADSIPASWSRRPGPPVIENETFVLEADPDSGGALRRIYDRRADREVVRDGGLAGALVLQPEHPKHPVWEEGPWHLLPAGPGESTGTRPGRCHVEVSPLGQRVISEVTLAGLRIRQRVTLWDGADRVDIRADVDGSIGTDHLLRALFDLDVPGALPVAEVGFGAVGRSFGFPDVDAARHLWTLDSPAHNWAGLSCPVRIDLRHSDGTVAAHAIGVAEVIAPGDAAPGDAASAAREVLAALAAQGVTATCTRPDGPRYGALDADSNLPDVRIVLGADNPYGAQVLDEAFAQALADNGRVFIPAARTARERWAPDADLRGPRDLPVLIVDDGAELARELAGGRVEVPVAAGLPGTSEPADDYSVAVVNRGTPGFVATPDGTLRINLMRSCSGWPAAVWIDGERRTVPDGSSFAWQHWTHTFELSLVAGAGDWRQAGFARAGHEINHPVLASQVPAGHGPLPGELSLISVTPDTVLLTSATSGADDGSIALRVYESAARPVTATVAMHGGVDAAYRTSPLDGDTGTSLPLRDGRPLVPLSAADIATVRVRPSLARPGGPGAALARVIEPVQPVFTRYWLHNAGPAPLGGVPISVHVHPVRLRLDGGWAQARVTVGCSGEPTSGRVELVVPPGVIVEGGDLDYDLKPGDYAEFTLRVFRTDAAAGRRMLAVRIRDHLGQMLEDTCEVVTGDAPDGPLVSARLDRGEVELSPGGSAELALHLSNLAQSEIRGEVSLISPFGTWDDPVRVGPRIRAFSIPAEGSATIPVTVTAADTARPGGHWWALARVAAHGRLVYTPAVAIRLS